jgi:hypothetical protein
VIAIPHELVAVEAEEVVGDAAAGGGKLNLFGIGAHAIMLRNVRPVALFTRRELFDGLGVGL